MKNFLAIYTGTPEAMADWNHLPEAEKSKRQAEGMQAWKDWGARHQKSIVEPGGPLGYTKRIGKDGITDIHNAMAAFTIVKAASHEAAAQLFMDHPHFTHFPGAGVEVMECLPIPA